MNKELMNYRYHGIMIELGILVIPATGSEVWVKIK